ncbi:glycoside hydrolase family 9 protein [Mucilaginibacter gossypii]|uniref:glycoside hydrolase family 9 protein n=1 Tax=Mucilaginibacter gossypii TaxID=551996 RepID=UPI000DCF3E00|nr:MULTISPECIES: glycoside hydrolase family 9 protein [Mucilaginibacter]QTE37993.1 glycoside hydrolase family 9 protein [Mucilaginibacter gossypii]RAV58686.1 glycosyl transferase [Mucilaginibacter rubeus]
MNSFVRQIILSAFFSLFCCLCNADPVFYMNQVGYDARGAKTVVVRCDTKLVPGILFALQNSNGNAVYIAPLNGPLKVEEWDKDGYFYQADFSEFTAEGKYRVYIGAKDFRSQSDWFQIKENALAVTTIPSVLSYYNKQRANTPTERQADAAVQLYGSDKTVDLRGGWCDASGDVSKYFSHLAYANFMSPQQIPLVTWSMINTVQTAPGLLNKLNVYDGMVNEALWGADYMMRALSKDDYFYMIVFSYFNKDPKARRVVGLKANSVTTDEYQAAFREGGGMAIASLARISQLKKDGDFKSAEYLAAAKRAFAHLLANNTRYDDDGKENIIDDYCALMAATELWIATDSSLYRDEARKRALSLNKRMSPAGYFIADDGDRPFWHAADAGLPVIALCRYLDKEQEADKRSDALSTIKKALDYNLKVTANVDNPFGYARQSFKFRGAVKDGFFIPHENETGWWWQGENARLGSLAAAALVGGRLVYPEKGGWGIKRELAEYASHQIAWILGCNPYQMCFMYQYGKNNVPYMSSNFGHGSGKGGISNGITGKKENSDGSGIDFKIKDNGNEWRWTEQWLPHAAWYLQAVTAMAVQQ